MELIRKPVRLCDYPLFETTSNGRLQCYVPQYPVVKIAQVTVCAQADLFNRTPSRLLWEEISHVFSRKYQCCLQPRVHSHSCVNFSNIELTKTPKVRHYRTMLKPGSLIDSFSS